MLPWCVRHVAFEEIAEKLSPDTEMQRTRVIN
jgi:hypothetical protein